MTHKLYEVMEDVLYEQVDLNSLPVGTRFYVVNGDWRGEIIFKNGKKYVRVMEEDMEFEILPDHDYELDIRLTHLYCKVTLNEEDRKNMQLALMIAKDLPRKEGFSDWCDKFLLGITPTETEENK